MSSSHRYIESSAFEYNISSSKRIDIPVYQPSNHSTYQHNEQQISGQIHLKNTTMQWIDDPITNSEKFRIKIDIEGFRSNEVILFLLNL